MRDSIQRVWSDEDGVLSFEWTLMATLLVIGVVGGVSGARDAIIDELGDAAQAMIAVDQSYSIDFPLIITIDGVSNSSGDSSFTDSASFTDCARISAPTGQPDQLDTDS